MKKTFWSSLSDYDIHNVVKESVEKLSNIHDVNTQFSMGSRGELLIQVQANGEKASSSKVLHATESPEGIVSEVKVTFMEALEKVDEPDIGYKNYNLRILSYNGGASASCQKCGVSVEAKFPPGESFSAPMVYFDAMILYLFGKAKTACICREVEPEHIYVGSDKHIT